MTADQPNGPAMPRTPDPTEQTQRSVDALRKELVELFDAKLDCEKDLTAERFRSVEVAQSIAEKLRLEQKADTSKAVDAALSAAKEAVTQQSMASTEATAKTERAVADQLGALRDNLAVIATAQDRVLAEVKDRVTRIESTKLGSAESRQGLYAALAAVAVLISVGIAIVGFIAASKP